MLCYNAGMDMTAYWLNFKKKRAEDGKYYYFYPYTRCEIDDTPTFFIDGKQYVRIEVSETEYKVLREMDDEEYNDERSVHNKRWTADVPRLANEDGDMVDFWTDRAEDKRTHDIADTSAKKWTDGLQFAVCRLSNGVFIMRTERASRSVRSRRWSALIRRLSPANWIGFTTA